MKSIESTGITRRSLIAAAVIGGASLILPKDVLAMDNKEIASSSINYLARPDLSETEFDILLRKQAEEEAAQIIAQALENPDAVTRAGGRPTYSTVYGRAVMKSTGRHDIAGQPPGGIQISSGSVFVQPSGGGSVGFSVALPGGLGSISVSVPKARRSLGVTGYSIDISGSGFYKITANVTHKIQPYVVYETRNGRRRVYARAASNLLHRVSLDKRRVR